jgi:hypothetical protein
MLASALALGVTLAGLGAVSVTRAVAQTAPADPTAAQSVPAAKAPAATAPAATARGRKTVGQGMNPQAEAGDPRVDTSAAGLATAPASAGTAGQPKTTKQADRVDLDTTTVTGNRELPKVMYVVPWKKSDIGDLGGKPMNSLLDEVLAPVDRDEFRREVVYYQAVNSDASQKGAGDAASPPAAAKQVEK